ncbi:hypothetical protein AOLI_G00041220 [Acnodon oligacanthus]
MPLHVALNQICFLQSRAASLRPGSDTFRPVMIYSPCMLHPSASEDTSLSQRHGQSPSGDLLDAALQSVHTLLNASVRRERETDVQGGEAVSGYEAGEIPVEMCGVNAIITSSWWAALLVDAIHFQGQHIPLERKALMVFKSQSDFITSSQITEPELDTENSHNKPHLNRHGTRSPQNGPEELPYQQRHLRLRSSDQHYSRKEGANAFALSSAAAIAGSIFKPTSDL